MTRIQVYSFLNAVILFITHSIADVVSTDRKIEFKINQNMTEMILSSVGLNIGDQEGSFKLNVNGNAIISKSLTIGNTNGSTNLLINGSYSFSHQTIGNQDSLNNDSMYFLNSSSENLLVYLPYAGNVVGRKIKLKKIVDENKVYISGGGNSLDLLGGVELNSLESLTVFSDGKSWLILDSTKAIETVASENLVGWYQFDQTSGNILNDSSSKSNSGNLISDLSFSSNLDNGKIGRSLSFNGSSDYISLNASSTLIEGDSSFSISAWFKTSSLYTTTNPSVGGRIFTLFRNNEGAGESSKLALALYGNGTDTINIFHNTLSGASDLLKTSTSFNDGNWHQIITTYDHHTDLLTLYYDGVLANSTDAGTLYSSGTEPARIGVYTDSTSSWFEGELDDIRVFDHALDNLQVQALYMKGN